MALKYNKATLKSLEDIFKNAGYVVRYERGQFKSGYCILHDKSVIVINRFFKEKGRIESLIDILQSANLDESKLTLENIALLQTIQKHYLAAQVAQ